MTRIPSGYPLVMYFWMVWESCGLQVDAVRPFNFARVGHSVRPRQEAHKMGYEAEKSHP